MKNVLKHRLEVTMDDGTEYVVFADQRDLAAWEASDVTGGQHTMIRHWAWSAMRRNGQYAGNFQKFTEKDCVQAASFSDEFGKADPGQAETEREAGEGDGLDPTQRA